MTRHTPPIGSSEAPRVLVVGGVDVDSRLDLMGRLADEFTLVGAGATAELEHEFAERGFEFHPFPLKRAVSPVSDLRSFWALVRICRRVRPSVVHAFATKPAVWGRLAARAAGVPVIVGTIPGLGSLYSSGGFVNRVLRGLYQRLQRLACGVSTVTVFQNVTDRDELVRAGVVRAEDTEVIPGSGVDTALLRPGAAPRQAVRAVRSEIGAADEGLVVTMVARLIRPKGVLEFARAARLLADTHPTTRFVLVGPVDPASVDRLGPLDMDEIRRSVIWLGRRTDVPDVLAASDVFVLPSYYREGMPRVLLEAGAIGLPSVATRSPGCRDVIEDGVNGLLVEPRSVEQLARAVGRLLDEPETRMRLAAAARARAVDTFDVNVIARHHSELYWRLLHSHLPGVRSRGAEPQVTPGPTSGPSDTADGTELMIRGLAS